MNISPENLFWNLYARVYDSIMHIPQYTEMMERIVDLLEIRAKDAVLDAGCGTGNLLQLLRNEKIDYYGIDDSISMLSRATNKFSNDPRISSQFSRYDLNSSIPFADNRFDKIVAVNSLYAVNSPSYTVKELLRVLKPNGILIAVNPKENTEFFKVYTEIINAGGSVIGKVIMFIRTLPLFLFNALIRMKAQSNKYHFMSRSDWKKILGDKEYKYIKYSEIYIQSNIVIIKK